MIEVTHPNLTGTVIKSGAEAECQYLLHSYFFFLTAPNPTPEHLHAFSLLFLNDGLSYVGSCFPCSGTSRRAVNDGTKGQSCAECEAEAGGIKAEEKEHHLHEPTLLSRRNDTTSPSSRKSQYRHCFSGDDEKKNCDADIFFFPPSWTDLTVIYQLPSTMILILYYHFGRVPRSCCSYLDILVSANMQRLQTHSAPDARVADVMLLLGKYQKDSSCRDVVVVSCLMY